MAQHSRVGHSVLCWRALHDGEELPWLSLCLSCLVAALVVEVRYRNNVLVEVMVLQGRVTGEVQWVWAG